MTTRQTSTIYIAGVNDPNRQQRNGWYSLHQLSSMITGALIFMSGGMNMAQGLGWSQLSITGFVNHFHYSWFIAVIVGTILSVQLRFIIPKKFLMATSSVLILAGGAIYIAFPKTLDALIAARYLNGIAVGLVIVPFLMHASEISRNSSRGACLAIEQYAMTLGIAIQIIYISQWDHQSHFPLNCFHGVLDIIFAILAAASLFYFVESPLDYIRMGDEASALDCMISLQRSPGITVETNTVLEQYKSYVREQENYSFMDCISHGILPLLKMIFFRSMMLAFTFSLPLTLTLHYSQDLTVHSNAWSPILAACLRIVGGFLALTIVDNFGRKLTSLVSGIIIGSCMVAIAVILNSRQNGSQEMASVTSLCLVIQFFAGLYAPFTSTYMGEAFPLKPKAYLMGLCVIVEQIIQIIVCASKSNGADGAFMAKGIMILIVCSCLFVMIPETKKTSLKDAQERFKRFFDCQMY